MKKINMKKFLSSVMATAIVGSTFSAVTSFAAAPSIYVDIVYEDDDTARADVYLSNAPDVMVITFNLALESGWDFCINSNNLPSSTLENCVSYSKVFEEDAWHKKEYSTEYLPNEVFVCFISQEDCDWNGRLISFYIEKNDNYNSSNAGINISIDETNELYSVTDDINYLPTASIPEMVGAYEFIVGDANGDNTILASDAAKILNVTNTYTSLNVNSIKDSFTTYFENAACAAAPDADRNGVITREDANEVLNAYSAIQAGLTYNGMVGKKDVFEDFN